jgi:hypothetical protein
LLVCVRRSVVSNLSIATPQVARRVAQSSRFARPKASGPRRGAGRTDAWNGLLDSIQTKVSN